MLARGTINLEGFTQIFCKVAEISGPLHNCKILIDLLDAKCKLETGDVDRFFSGLGSARLSDGSKIALICARANKQYDCLCTISASLSKQGFKVAVFEDSNVAAGWLVDIV